ncbi:MAG: response regulator transcription factor [Isosphaeraceae bacterium]
MMTTILIMESSLHEAEQLEHELKKSPGTHAVYVTQDGREGLRIAKSRTPDLIVLDLCLTMGDGFDVLRDLRREEVTREIPVIVATVKSSVADQLVCFAIGADDYVVKPYILKLLVARIEAILRRRVSSAPLENASVVAKHGLAVDHYAHRAFRNGQELPLTLTEFRLLEVLLRRPGRVFSRSELMNALVGEEVALLEGTINAYIRNLRQKLGEEKRLIETVRGVGYRLRDTDEE